MEGGSVFPRPPCSYTHAEYVITSVLVFLTHDSFCPYYTARTSETLTSAGTSSATRSGEMGHSDALTVEAANFTDSPAACDALLEIRTCSSTSTGT